MDRDNLAAFYEDNIGLVRSVALKGYRRLVGIGASVDMEDLVQELSITFIRAYEKFDPECGKFSTYFTRSAYNHLNKMAERYEAERIELGMRSFEEMASWGEDEEGDVFDSIPSDAPTPEEVASRMSALRDLDERLTPLARLVLEWTFDPPDFVEFELRALQAHAEYARSKGFNRRCYVTVTNLVCDLLERTTDLPAAEIRNAKRQIKSLELQQ